MKPIIALFTLAYAIILAHILSIKDESKRIYHMYQATDLPNNSDWWTSKTESARIGCIFQLKADLTPNDAGDYPIETIKYTIMVGEYANNPPPQLETLSIYERLTHFLWAEEHNPHILLNHFIFDEDWTNPKPETKISLTQVFQIATDSLSHTLDKHKDTFKKQVNEITRSMIFSALVNFRQIALVNVVKKESAASRKETPKPDEKIKNPVHLIKPTLLKPLQAHQVTADDVLIVNSTESERIKDLQRRRLM